MSKSYTVEKGIRAREHPTRKHGLQPDRYFFLRFTVDGKQREESLGWASEGWTLAKVRAELARLKTAQTTGEGARTMQERRDNAQREREAVQRAQELEQQRLTVKRLWDVYQSQRGEYSGKPADRTNFGHLSPLHGRYPDTLRTHEVTVVARNLEAQGKSPQTVKHVLELLRRLVNFGVKQELIDRPARLRFEMPKVDNIKTECLTAEQIARLLNALDADPDQNLAAMMKLALFTGIRRSALLGLKWADLNFKDGYITLRGEEAKSGKTTHIPLNESAKTVLRSIEPNGSEYLFQGKDGAQRVNINRFLKRIRTAADLPADFRPLHGLRHTFASQLASSG